MASICGTAQKHEWAEAFRYDRADKTAPHAATE